MNKWVYFLYEFIYLIFIYLFIIYLFIYLFIYLLNNVSLFNIPEILQIKLNILFNIYIYIKKAY